MAVKDDPAKIPKPERVKLRIMGSDTEYGISIQNTGQPGNNPITFYEQNVTKIVAAMLPIGSKRLLPGFRAILPSGDIIHPDIGQHLEYTTGECLGARELSVHETAGLEILAAGVRRFNENNPTLPNISLHKTNCGCELDEDKFPRFVWGAHASFLSLPRVNDDLRENLMKEFLMSFWPLIGNGWFLVKQQKYLRFIFSQRAESMFTGRSERSTTNPRPMFHLRNEPHADKLVWKRIHEITLNANMSQLQIFLKYVIYDLILAMVEAKDFLRPLPLIDYAALGYEEITVAYNAISKIFNQDLYFQRAVKLRDGRSWTSIDFQLHYLNEARRFFAEGRGTLTPERKTGLKLWAKTLTALQRWDLPWLAKHLDWAAILYYEVIPRIRRLGLDPNLLLTAPNFPSEVNAVVPPGIPYDYQFERKGKNENLLDYFLYFIVSYANVDASASPYGIYLRRGLIKQIFTPEEIEFAKNNPPPRTRAKLREEIVKHPPADTTLQYWSWDSLSFSILDNPTINFDLPNPYRYSIKTDLEEFRRPPPKYTSPQFTPSPPEYGGS